MIHVLRDVIGHKVVEIWHREDVLEDFSTADCIVLPGGFSYGDYVRAGAIAHLAPVMEAVGRHAQDGGLVWGICNGFQILCEALLLPGVLLRNAKQKFIGKDIYLRVESTDSLITRHYSRNEVLRIPIAHADGRYMARKDTLSRMEQNDQILFRYCSANGELTEEANVNGSISHIAGICNEQRNVFGMMPHPERASEGALGNTDGLRMFQSMVNHLETIV